MEQPNPTPTDLGSRMKLELDRVNKTLENLELSQLSLAGVLSFYENVSSHSHVQDMATISTEDVQTIHRKNFQLMKLTEKRLKDLQKILQQMRMNSQSTITNTIPVTRQLANPTPNDVILETTTTTACQESPVINSLEQNDKRTTDTCQQQRTTIPTSYTLQTIEEGIAEQAFTAIANTSENPPEYEAEVEIGDQAQTTVEDHENNLRIPELSEDSTVKTEEVIIDQYAEHSETFVSNNTQQTVGINHADDKEQDLDSTYTEPPLDTRFQDSEQHMELEIGDNADDNDMNQSDLVETLGTNDQIGTNETEPCAGIVRDDEELLSSPLSDESSTMDENYTLNANGDEEESDDDDTGCIIYVSRPVDFDLGNRRVVVDPKLFPDSRNSTWDNDNETSAATTTSSTSYQKIQEMKEKEDEYHVVEEEEEEDEYNFDNQSTSEFSTSHSQVSQDEEELPQAEGEEECRDEEDDEVQIISVITRMDQISRITNNIFDTIKLRNPQLVTVQVAEIAEKIRELFDELVTFCKKLGTDEIANGGERSQILAQIKLLVDKIKEILGEDFDIQHFVGMAGAWAGISYAKFVSMNL